jgi:sialic acid synthase SpsE
MHAQGDNPLFTVTKDSKLIAIRTQLALPSAQRALELLTTASDPEAMARALASINTTYKYMRAAEESTRMLMGLSKYPDPLMPIRADQMQEVRSHCLACLVLSDHVRAGKQAEINTCAESLATVVTKLEALLLITF